VEHLGAVADDARVLDLGADHEARHVLQEHQRDVERVADLDEVRGLVGESTSRMPPRCIGLLATMPTELPPMRARQVMMLRAQRA
jgi:hypothetical protein